MTHRSQAQTRRRRGRVVAVIVVAVIVAAIGTYLPLTLLAPTGYAHKSVAQPVAPQTAAVQLSLPTDAESAVSVSDPSGYIAVPADGILAASGGSKPVPMASISKLITALVILSKKPLGASDAGPIITFYKTDAALYDKYFLLNATIAAMPSGSSMSEHDALETMLVVSASNYAEAVSTWAFGSQTAFLAAAKSWLKANGLNDTRMVEPTGLNDSNTSTPADLIALGKLAMASPVVSSIVSKSRLDVPSLAGLPNTNDLLGVDGVNGIKTGTLDSFGSNLLFSASVSVGTKAPLDVVGVVLGAGSHSEANSDAQQLIASIQAGFHQVPLVKAGQVFGSYLTPWGSSASIVAAESKSVLTWSDTPITVSIKTDALKLGRDGQKVGSVTWVAGKSTVTVPLELKGSLTGPGGQWRITHPFELLGG